MYCSISSILFIICKKQSVCLVYILIIGLDIIHHMLKKVAYVHHQPSTQCPALYISCFSGTKQLRLFLLPPLESPLESPLDGMLVTLISSRCSGNEPALLPRWQTRESRGNRAQDRTLVHRAGFSTPGRREAL